MKIEFKNGSNYTNKELLDKLYSKEFKIVFNVGNDKIDCTVDLGSSKKPDCCIGNFGYNFYYRTPKDLKYEKYFSLGSLVGSIKRVLKNNNMVINNIDIVENKGIFAHLIIASIL